MNLIKEQKKIAASQSNIINRSRTLSIASTASLNKTMVSLKIPELN
jgi:hypothetical protein